MMKKYISIVFFLLFSVGSFAQLNSILDKVHIGASLGYHYNTMRFPGLAKGAYPDKDPLHSAVVSLYAQYDFTQSVSIRPEMAFLNRGGRMSIRNVSAIRSGEYFLRSGYLDFRLPVIYNFNISSPIIPYLYVAPILAFSTGGVLCLQSEPYNGPVNFFTLDLSKGNMAAAYFAMSIGGGARYPIKFGSGREISVGLEAGYEYGITDTYSKMEKSGQSISVNTVDKRAPDGPRKHSGFEVKGTVQVPLSIFKKRKHKVKEVEYVVVEQPKVEEQPVVKPEKPCYTLDEIQDMISEGKDVKGKTICAIDEINFDTNESVIKDDAKIYLDQLAYVLSRIDIEVEVRGHTDNTGTREFNMDLSKRRALAVVNYLIKKGVPEDRITYTYHGDRLPLAPNNTPEGRKINRRVEFELIK